MHNKTLQGCSEQTALEGQDLPHTYLALHELESGIIIIIKSVDAASQWMQRIPEPESRWDSLTEEGSVSQSANQPGSAVQLWLAGSWAELALHLSQYLLVLQHHDQ